jgi:flagellar biosynthetic protein FlhB
VGRLGGQGAGAGRRAGGCCAARPAAVDAPAGLPLEEALALGRDQLLCGVLALLLVFVLFGLIDVPAQLFFFCAASA